MMLIYLHQFLMKRSSTKYYNLTRRYQWQSGVYGHKKMINESTSDYKSNIILTKDNCQIYQLINAYREHGHKRALINPLQLSNESFEVPEFDVNKFGLNLKDTCNTEAMINSKNKLETVEEVVQFLENTYCKNLATEFMHIEDINEREWFCNRYEEIVHEDVDEDYQREILVELLKSQALDKFLAKKFATVKRYGCEGAESQIAFFTELFKSMSQDGVGRLIIGSHHRGRLNFLIGLLGMSPALLFRKIKGKSEFPVNSPQTGDVISHLCHSVNLNIEGRKLLVSVTKPPSHLEAVCPVSVGETRAWQQMLKDGSYDESGCSKIITANVQVHGDAALMGQGVSQECILMSHLPNFRIGGVVHLVVNNQLGFTAPAFITRGTRYSTDISKIIATPVLHVNGDYPDEVIKATRIAVEFQRKFRKSVFIDLCCYRRWGHNELDDPSYTNPDLYHIITSKSTVPDQYKASLIDKNIIDEKDAELVETDYNNYLTGILEKTDTLEIFECEHLNQDWKNYTGNGESITDWDTGVETNLLKYIGIKSVDYPSHFKIHPNLARTYIKGRVGRCNSGEDLDWGTAETLAFGSLLYDGFNVRISGQDVGRGTFSHRHLMLIDQENSDIFVPLNNLFVNQTAKIEVANSLLSEEAVLGFEYGFSSVSPHNLVIWEAQFGDFFNGAQIHIDTYVSSAEAKWGSQSGLVILLPHGYDGAGPEHSSSRMERFLQLTDSKESSPDAETVNLNVVNPTTPAQYFHLLRRQMIRNYRKPLIVIAPKTLIRLPEATSTLNDISPGSSFRQVIGDTKGNYSTINKVIFVSGKHYYALKHYMDDQGIDDTAIIRVEELCPFPVHQLRKELLKYKHAKYFIWSQEEPQNMGAWSFCKPRFENMVGCKLRYCGRNASSSPAVGIGELHRKEAAYVIQAPFSVK